VISAITPPTTTTKTLCVFSRREKSLRNGKVVYGMIIGGAEDQLAAVKQAGIIIGTTVWTRCRISYDRASAGIYRG